MSAQNVTEDQVYSALRKCMDPEIPVNVVDLGLVYGVDIKPKNNVDIKMTMTTRGCPLHDTLVSDVKRWSLLHGKNWDLANQSFDSK
jgi:metal-sulfur cluster biosynthetic enzyme